MAYPQINSFQQQGMFLVPVQNETAVNTYLVAAGNTVALADFSNGVMWLKSTSAQGIPEPVRKFELKEITPKPTVPGAENMVSREEFTALSDKINKLLDALGEGKPHE